MASSSRNIKVGLFLIVALGALVTVVLLLGDHQNLFSRKVRLYTSFLNINGLVVGTPVRLAGIAVGLVESIEFDRDLKVKRVHVTLGIEKRYLERIREDSIAGLGSKGLLGDMIVNVSVGSAEAAPLRADSTLPSQEAAGLTEIIASVKEAIGGITEMSGDVGKVMKSVVTKEVAADVGRIIHSAAAAMGQAEHGKGLVHELLYEPRMAKDATALIATARSVAGTADRALRRVDQILVETDVKQAVLHIQIAARELGEVISAVRTGKGLVHTLIYEEDRSHLVENLAALSTQLRTISDDLKEGKGTIGALLKDPTIYTDLKIILGNVKRSRLLRSLVRYTMAADDLAAPKLPSETAP